MISEAKFKVEMRGAEMKKHKKRKVEWWAMARWNYGAEQVCSTHTSETAAIRAARKCERFGGSVHRIVKVEEVKAYPQAR